MEKQDKKIHEYRMSGARWMLDIVKRDGIEAAEEELKLRGAVFVPMEIPKSKLEELSRTLTEQCYHTILSTVPGLLSDKYGFGKVRLQRFKDQFDEMCMNFYATQPCGEPYVQISDYARELRDKGIDLSVEVCEDVERERREMVNEKI